MGGRDLARRRRERERVGARSRPALRRRRLRGDPLLRRDAVPARRRTCAACATRRAACARGAAAATTSSRRSATRAIERFGEPDGYLRLIVTRGRGMLGVSPHTCERPTMILIVATLAALPGRALRARRRRHHLEPAARDARQRAAADQVAQLPDLGARRRRGARSRRPRGAAAQRRRRDRRVHGRQRLPRLARARPHAAGRGRRPRRHHARPRDRAAARRRHRRRGARAS